MANSLASILSGAGNDPYAQGTNISPLIGDLMAAQNMMPPGAMAQPPPVVPGQPMPGQPVPGQPMPGIMPFGAGQLGGMGGAGGMPQGNGLQGLAQLLAGIL